MHIWNHARWAFRIGACLLFLVDGCTGSAPTLVVDLRTDMSPAVEFDWVETELYRDTEVTAEPARTALNLTVESIRDERVLAGIRLAEFDDLSPGDWLVRVRLMRSTAGEVREVIAGRRLVRLGSESRALTVLITRDCTGVRCPRMDDNPTQTACLGGRCVDRRCSPETREFCPAPRCAADGDCAPVYGGGQCGEGRCLEGTCVTYLSDTRCLAAEQCGPEGCAPRQPTASDAGPASDALPSDAGVDGGVQVTAVEEIALGSSHTYVRLSTGEVRAWGRNDYGQLGDGTIGTDRLMPASVMGLSGAVQLAAGYRHACARLSSGEVRCWGRNDFGQVGGGTSGTNELRSVRVEGLTDAVEIAAGWYHTCARLSSNEVRCWGRNAAGQLGDGAPGTDRSAPVSVMGLSGAVEIAAGAAHTCARLSSGEVRCWGSDDNGQLGNDADRINQLSPVPVLGVTDAVELAASQRSTCARLRSGEVQCWGDNYHGQLADGGRVGSTGTPVSAWRLSDAVEISALQLHACARLSTGEVRCWGLNNYGQVGDGTSGSSRDPFDADRDRPTPVAGLSGALEIAVGGLHGCARLSSRELRCWGWNEFGQVGVGTSGNQYPTPVSVMDF